MHWRGFLSALSFSSQIDVFNARTQPNLGYSVASRHDRVYSGLLLRVSRVILALGLLYGFCFARVVDCARFDQRRDDQTLGHSYSMAVVFTRATIRVGVRPMLQDVFL